MLNVRVCDDFVMKAMKQTNTSVFFRWPRVAKMAGLWPVLLLFGCTHAIRPPATVANPAAAVTGIPACDDYLNHYLACHRAAGTYPADTLPAHYQIMHDTLVQEAGDPKVRPYLANRCQGLTQQLHDALQGRACTPAPATAAPSTH